MRCSRILLWLAACLLITGCAGGAAESPSDPGTTSATGSPNDAEDPTPDPGELAAGLGLEYGWGPTTGQLDEATRIVRRLSLEELAGQVIVADWSGTEAPVELVRSLHLGGVIAFSGNVASAAQVRRVNRVLQRRSGRDWPLFIGVDQEGGLVERLADGVTPYPAFMSAGAAGDTALTGEAYRAAGAELRRLGFTVDFAPVADVTSGPDDPTIGSRSAGSDPRLVAEQVIAASQGYLAGGVVPVAKHFPGHGSVPADSHETLPVQTRTRAILDRVDLVPFRDAAAAGAPAVMVGHLDVTAIDPGVPSSMSHRVVTGVLRRDLAFPGLVVTDSLRMAGVADRFDSASAAVTGLRAGNDVLLMPPDPAAARDGIVAAVREGRLPIRRLRQAAARQIALMLHVEDLGGVGGSAAEASAALSAAAITVVAGPCTGRVVSESVSPVGDPEAVAAFTEAARAGGLAVGGGDTVWLIGRSQTPVTADVAVATDTPYVLENSVAPVRIATYGVTPGAMTALVRVLTGEATAPGLLPVEVPGLTSTGCGPGQR